jgi:formate dehydrogenase assembly factor FdhD
MTRDERATEAPPLAAVTAGITLCGFVRDGNANVYTELWRLET